MSSFEQRYANLLRGGEDRRPLLTDGYKWSMGQAGFPLRDEVFYLHFRKGKPLYCPFDFAEVARLLVPRLPNTREQGFLLANGYGLTPAMEVALQGPLRAWSIPKRAWVNPQEPVLTLKGPSFLVSWMEALVIAFNFPMQIATALIEGQRLFKATCEDEAAIIELVAEVLGVSTVRVEVQEEQFRWGIRDRLARLRKALSGDIDRAFEVGTRSMTCYQHHKIVLEECKAAGITRTANVQGAYDLYMIPVGTTGHEHQERHGADIYGFRAIRDQRPEPPSYLFDTYDPIRSGIPAAVQVMREDPSRKCSARFDSGDQPRQLQVYVEADREYGFPNLFYLFMDGYDSERVYSMEVISNSYHIPKAKRHFGIGGWLAISEYAAYSRNTVAMVYKLCQTGGRNVRKYSGTPGKASLAGDPCVVVTSDATRWICQSSEVAADFQGMETRLLDECPRPTQPSRLSPETERLCQECETRDLGGL